MLRDLMCRDVVTVEPHEPVSRAAQIMAEKDVGCVLVLSSGRPRGILTDRDIVVQCIARNIDVFDTTVENILSESLETCHETDGIFECIRKMRDARVRRIPVVNDHGIVVGIISFGVLLAFLATELAELTRTTTPAEEIGLAA